MTDVESDSQTDYELDAVEEQAQAEEDNVWSYPND